MEFCTKQQLRVVEIRKNIFPHCSKKQSFSKIVQKPYPKNISLKQAIYLKRNYLLKQGVHQVFLKQEVLHTNLKHQFFLKREWKNCIVQILIAQSLPNLSARHRIAQSLIKVKLQVRIALNLPKRKLVLFQNPLTPPQGLQTHHTCLLMNVVEALNKLAAS